MIDTPSKSLLPWRGRKRASHAVMLAAVGAVAITVALSGCGSGSAEAEDLREARLSTAAYRYLESHGAHPASRDDPHRWYYAGDLLLPAGGPTCSVARIATDKAAPTTADSVRRGRAVATAAFAPQDRARCLRALEDAFAGFRG
jgi:hypothetical protein